MFLYDHDEDDQSPDGGTCPVCKRYRPRNKSTINNFGCIETEADDEDRDLFVEPGAYRLECCGCGSTCVPGRVSKSRMKRLTDELHDRRAFARYQTR